MYKIGVLAIQGDFNKHAHVINKLGHRSIEVRTAEQLRQTDALILPGGESTTVLKQIHESDLFRAIQAYANDHPLMGTCAGLISLAKKVTDLPYPPLALIDITVDRNAYGRQRDSFIAPILLTLNGKEFEYEAVFIRAPLIKNVGPGVQILARYKKEAVAAATDNILVCSFHPELTEETQIHQFFIDTFLSPRS